MSDMKWDDCDIEFISRVYTDGFSEISDKSNLFAHYTSMNTAIKIIDSEQIWLSHPLLMNDKQEMIHGISIAQKIFFEKDQLVRSALSDKYEIALDIANYMFNNFNNEGYIDTYVICLTEHEVGDNDGILSMWRGYGDSGSGAAIIFNSGFIDKLGTHPLVTTKVTYNNNVEQEMSSLLDSWIKWYSAKKESNKFEEEIFIAKVINTLIDAVLFKSLGVKHKGFKEEREIRLIYMRHRDRDNILTKFFDYQESSNGIEPKLKLPILPFLGKVPTYWSFSDILDSIILGPAISSPMTLSTFKRALQNKGKHWAAERVSASAIPFRSRVNAPSPV